MDIDLQIVQSIFDYFLYIGMTLAIFRTEGIYPVEKDIIKISINCWEMSFFSSIKIDLHESVIKDITDIIRDISFLSIWVKKKVFVFV